MNNSELNHFFEVLAGRLRNETDLSEFTFAALECIPEFKHDFIHYFYKDLPTGNQDIVIIEAFREQPLPSGDGKPDFIFKGESWDLIIENKLSDRKYHFDKYGKQQPKDGRRIWVGLIANHTVKETAPENWRVRTWRKFVEDFTLKDYKQYNQLFQAYLQYVKTLINMTEIKTFRFDPQTLFALTYFIHMVEQILGTVENEGKTWNIGDKRKGDWGDCWAGYSASLKANGSEQSVTLFFGIDFDPQHSEPAITVDIHKDRNPLYFDLIRKGMRVSTGFNVKWKDYMVQLQMPPEKFRSLNSEQSEANQLDILRCFFIECCDFIIKAIH